MAPQRQRPRRLEKLGSLTLAAYANNQGKVVAELAYHTDVKVNTNGSPVAPDAPIEIPFDEFLQGVNTRGAGTKTGQRKTTIDQATSILLAVYKYQVELVASADDPGKIETIVILPKAKELLATFLPKLRGYGDIPYDKQYRGTLALAKRHFFPDGRQPTKREIQGVLLEAQQKIRSLQAPPITRSLSIQAGSSTNLNFVASPSTTGVRPTVENKNSMVIQTASLADMAGPSGVQGDARMQDSAIEAETDHAVPEETPDESDNNEMVSEPDTEPAQQVPSTPRPSHSLNGIDPAAGIVNPYLTPMSNPRQTSRSADVPALLPFSPVAATNAPPDIFGMESPAQSSSEGVSWMMQEAAMIRGLFSIGYAKFMQMCETIQNLETEKTEIKKELDLTKKQLDDTEASLRNANADKTLLEKKLSRMDKLWKAVRLVIGKVDALDAGMDDDDDE